MIPNVTEQIPRIPRTCTWSWPQRRFKDDFTSWTSQAELQLNLILVETLEDPQNLERMASITKTQENQHIPVTSSQYWLFIIDWKNQTNTLGHSLQPLANFKVGQSVHEAVFALAKPRWRLTWYTILNLKHACYTNNGYVVMCILANTLQWISILIHWHYGWHRRWPIG